MPGATVSVVIAAYNAMPYLTQCITSVAEQSIGRDRIEVIVVDDGSTDGTAAELERLQGLYPTMLRVFRQENSGGPSAPATRASTTPPARSCSSWTPTTASAPRRWNAW